MKIYAIQLYREVKGVWESIYLTTFGPDAEDTFDDLAETSAGMRFRLVSFTVTDLAFVATYATDFAVLDKINF